NNYASLTVNVRLSGAAIDFWALDPVALFFGSVGVNSQAPHPKAALLGANFMLSREAEQVLTTRGRMPTRHDVRVNPAYVSERLKDRKILATIFAGDEQKKWQGLFKDLFRPKLLRAATNRASLAAPIQENVMRLCRYDDDRLGVVRGEMVHDVTEAQTQIRADAPYAMKGDAVIAALPAWRSRLEEMGAKAPGKPVAQVRLLSPVARPSKLVAAPTNYKAHIEEMAARAAAQNAKPSPAIGTAGLFLKANSSLVGPSEGVA